MINQDDRIAYWVEYGNKVMGTNVQLETMLNYSKAGVKLTEIGKIGYHFSVAIDDFLGNRIFSVTTMFIKPEHRTLENLNKLMESVEDEARKNKCNTIYIGGVNSSNDTGLYKYLTRKGFKQAIMRKEI